jgi:replicative DNA helicase
MTRPDNRSRAAEIRRTVGIPDDPEPAAPEWEPFVPLDAIADLPVFPVKALPDWGAAMVEAVAESTQTPLDLPGVVYLGVLAVAAGGRAEVEVKPGWREPVNLYAAPAMPPGSRKSAVFREMTTPLLDAERALQEAARAEINDAAVSLDIAREQAERAVKEASKKLPGPGADEAKANAIAAKQRAEEVAIPAWPRLVADDVTPEALASLLCEQGGRMAVLSAEGDLFDIMCGRYGREGQLPNLGVFLKGHAGDLLLVDRKGREPERIERPALTIVVTIQPQVLLDIARRPALRGRGLLARVLYCLPPDTVGFRRVQVDDVPDEIRSAWHGQVKALALSLAEWTDPAVLLLTPEARQQLSGYQEEIEPRLRASGGDLADLRDWASKLAGATVRLAALLHLATHLRDDYQRPIEPDTMERAIQLGRYFTEHARVAFRQMGMDPVISDAQVILAWIKRNRAGEVSKRDLFNGVRSIRFQKAADLDECLAVLIEHGYLRLVEQSSTTKRGGRPSSPRYAVHPEALLWHAQPAQPAQPLNAQVGVLSPLHAKPRTNSAQPPVLSLRGGCAGVFRGCAGIRLCRLTCLFGGCAGCAGCACK